MHLFQASRLPMAIIIVGVGEADFDGMMCFILKRNRFSSQLYKCMSMIYLKNYHLSLYIEYFFTINNSIFNLLEWSGHNK